MKREQLLPKKGEQGIQKTIGQGQHNRPRPKTQSREDVDTAQPIDSALNFIERYHLLAFTLSLLMHFKQNL